MGEPHPSDALRGRRGDHLAGRVVGLAVDAVRGAPGAVRVARELARLGAEVQPLLPPSAEAWVPRAALEYATGRAPLAWPSQEAYDAVLLAPLGPGMAAKLAHRVPDTSASAAALRHLGRAPVLAAPVGGVDAAPLAALGVQVVEGAFDAHGEPRPELLGARVAGALSPSPLRGRTALLVAGGAFEAWDAMRVLATRGDAALARAVRLELERRGARVSPLLGPWARPWQRGERCFETLADLALMARLLGPHDLAVVEEALPGWQPHARQGKLASGQQGLALDLRAAPPFEAAGARIIGYRREPAKGAEAQAEELALAAERALA